MQPHLGVHDVDIRAGRAEHRHQLRAQTAMPGGVRFLQVAHPDARQRGGTHWGRRTIER